MLHHGRRRQSRADAGVERLYRSHRLSMVRLALLLVDDRETAEDVAQDAFAALHRRWHSIQRPGGRGVGYLRTSVVNGVPLGAAPAPDGAAAPAGSTTGR